eukprot:TRINITY_DN14940_c0_g1_i2.p1 TRINITY_DN14940_c0_g1~~TRINITY_DN14940_c0_g1_i2.p1  ORF type:complete len:478 (+),score=116.09 TRINITY_DN14940_c0_g1_i2:446-1879(+)
MKSKNSHQKWFNWKSMRNYEPTQKLPAQLVNINLHHHRGMEFEGRRSCRHGTCNIPFQVEKIVAESRNFARQMDKNMLTRIQNLSLVPLFDKFVVILLYWLSLELILTAKASVLMAFANGLGIYLSQSRSWTLQGLDSGPNWNLLMGTVGLLPLRLYALGTMRSETIRLLIHLISLIMIRMLLRLPFHLIFGLQFILTSCFLCPFLKWNDLREIVCVQLLIIGLSCVMKEKKDKLEHSLQVQALQFASIYHAMQQPISGITLSLEILHEQVKKFQHANGLSQFTEDIKTRINAAKSHVISAISVTDKLIQTKQKPATSNDCFELRSFFDRIATLLKSYPLGQQVSFQVEISQDLPKFLIDFDGVALQQVLMNLLTNSFKFTKKGQVKLSVRTDGKYLQIEVDDTGIGMSSNKLEGCLKMGGDGVGLGLSKMLVERMKGEFDAKSRLNGGTNIRFQIPMRTSDGNISPKLPIEGSRVK